MHSDTRPKARAYGHPGGWRRERYLQLMREWVGRGVELPDPYEPALVRSAPREIRRWLAKALAEEETARIVSTLGIGFTVWNNVAVAKTGGNIESITQLSTEPTSSIEVIVTVPDAMRPVVGTPEVMLAASPLGRRRRGADLPALVSGRTSVVDMVAAHERSYLEHCRRHVLSLPRVA